MGLDADKIKKEVEVEVYVLLRMVHYEGDKLLESVKNTANLVLREYGIENTDIKVGYSTGGTIEIRGIEKAVNKFNNDE